MAGNVPDKKSTGAGKAQPVNKPPDAVTSPAVEDVETKTPPSPGFFSKAKGRGKHALEKILAVAKTVLDPRNIIKYLLSRLWKPLLFFTLLFSLFLGGAYAASSYKFINAKTALDFEWAMPSLRAYADNRVVREILPVAEWSVAAAAAAGDLIQSGVERREVAMIKAEQERLAQEAAEQEAARLAEEKLKEAQAPQDNAGAADAEDRRRAAERSRQEELKKIAESRQQEIDKRAIKLATYYAAMQPAEAVKILQNMEDEEIILILNRMPDALVAQILAGFTPERASGLSQNMLRVPPMPDLGGLDTGLL